MKPRQNTKPARQAAIRHRARRRHSLRLPIVLAAKIEALCERHSNNKRSEILRDLIELGLQEFEHAASSIPQESAEVQADTRQHLYLLTGPFSEFHGLLFKHHLALEHESSIDQSDPKPAVDEYALGDSLS